MNRKQIAQKEINFKLVEIEEEKEDSLRELKEEKYRAAEAVKDGSEFDMNTLKELFALGRMKIKILSELQKITPHYPVW